MSGRLGRHLVTTAAVVLAVMAGGSALAQEQEEEEISRAWTNDTELSLVVASGNSQANTLGFRNVYEYRWTGANLTWETGWVRAASRDGDRVAVARPGDLVEIVEPTIEIDSQRFYSKLGFRQEIDGRHYWFTNFDSARDEPSNIRRQFIGAGGFGTQWADRDGLRFRTEYGISVTREDLDLEGESSFGGYRLAYALNGGVTSSLTTDSELTFDGSFEEQDDVRTDWLNGVSVSISDQIALRSSVRLLFRNIPALEALALVTPVVGVVIGTVEVPKKQLDATFTTSLVITF